MVGVAVAISPKGEVVDVRVIEADHPDLVDLAFESIRGSKFSAGRENGKAIFSQLATRVRIGGNEEYEVAPKVRSQTKPEYPYSLRRAGLSGRVNVEFIVNTKGRVEAAYAVETSHPAFRQAALDAVEQWRFEPGTVEEKPVSARMNVPIIFSITDAPFKNGWVIKRPKKFPENFPESLKWDKAPRLVVFNPPVYPRGPLMEKIKGKVKVQFVIAPHGGIFATKILESPHPELGGAAVAAVETFKFEPATRKGKPCGASLIMEFDFRPSKTSDSPVANETMRLVRVLRNDPDRITKSSLLDEIPPLVFSKQPVIPTMHRDSPEDALVRAEVIIGRRGTVELARVIEQTAPEYGYAATQALSEWQFEPPRSEGKVVDTRLIIPLIFKGTGG